MTKNFVKYKSRIDDQIYEVEESEINNQNIQRISLWQFKNDSSLHSELLGFSGFSYTCCNKTDFENNFEEVTNE